MTAIRNTSLIEGNLADEPKCFAKNDKWAAYVSFTILHTDRRMNEETRQWEDGRTTAVRVDFHGPQAERYIRLIQERPDLFAKGTAVVAWGSPADTPNAYIDRENKPRSTQTLAGTKIIPDQIVNQRRGKAKEAQPPTMAAQQQAARQQGTVPPEYDPWAVDGRFPMAGGAMGI